jgi:hypothetical protein
LPAVFLDRQFFGGLAGATKFRSMNPAQGGTQKAGQSFQNINKIKIASPKNGSQ